MAKQSVVILRDFTGASASIKVKRDGTATLTVFVGGKRHKSEHKNEKAAHQAWRRWCN